MKFLELAEKVLSEVNKPLSSSEIWRYAEEKQYVNQLGSSGKTPARTMNAQLHISARDNKKSPFVALSGRPKKFYLKGLNYDPSDLTEVDSEVHKNDTIIVKFLETDLHAVLAYFVYYHLGAYSKTLDHRGSSKKQFGEWVHPDMVSCYFPLDDWKPEVYDLSMTIRQSAIILRSFEIKRQLSFSNLRESFFQAVSNSSWAHEGYLVTAIISEEEEFIQELTRLSNSFGIGVILLDLEDPDNSDIIIEPTDEEKLDWDTINKLAINPNFKDFLERIRKDIESKEIRKEWYDKIEDREVLIARFQNKKQV